jgi:hypothetical protein
LVFLLTVVSKLTCVLEVGQIVSLLKPFGSYKKEILPVKKKHIKKALLNFRLITGDVISDMEA